MKTAYEKKADAIIAAKWAVTFIRSANYYRRSVELDIAAGLPNMAHVDAVEAVQRYEMAESAAFQQSHIVWC